LNFANSARGSEARNSHCLSMNFCAGACEIGTLEVGELEIGAAEIGSGEICACEIGAGGEMRSG
jgi:hypothetical protein